MVNFISDCCSWTILFTIILCWFILVQLFNYNKRKKSLKGKVVLITGSANGFGRSLCEALAHEQCDLICVDIDKEANIKTVAYLKAINSNIKIIQFICDVTNENDVNQLAKNVYNEFTNVDILINNAGVVYPARLFNLTSAHIRKLIDINLISHFWTIRAFVPKMIENNSGLIIATGSIGCQIGVECMIPYCASKFAVLGLMESLQAELNMIDSNVKTLTLQGSFMGTRLLPKQIRKPGYYWINKIALLEVSDTKEIAQKTVTAIKEQRRYLYTKTYLILGIRILKDLLPEFVGDFIRKHIIKLEPHLQPLEESQFKEFSFITDHKL